MTFTAGARLGAYEITGPLGAGGMGEVYRARDTRLARDVALKILPDAFAADADRRARFLREAQVLAALNHPNVGAIHGFEEFASTGSLPTTVRALVLELVEGPTLAERIARGPIPVDEALHIARQIADALEAAHDHGVVHRDLKPANIKLRPDGTVKVLDFGIAKPAAVGATGMADAGDRLAHSPTITTPAATRFGVILGTAAYMSPEQAKGQETDRTSDIWAFGCVLFEMLTGRPTFGGATTTEVLSEVLKSDPDWSRLPAETPESVRRLLRRCLRKDRKERLQHIDGARLEILDASRPEGATAPAGPRWPSLLPWAVAALSLVTAGWLAAREAQRPPAVAETVKRVTINLPEGLEISTISAPTAALSPDGTQLVFTGAGGGARRLYLRRLDQDQAVPLAGTETGTQSMFSPDGRAIAFIAADRRLKTVSLADGLVTVIAQGVDRSFGATWAPDGQIVYVSDRVLWQIAPTGGEPRRLTTLDTTRGDLFHAWPAGLPNGAVLFTAVTGTDAGGMRIEAVTAATGTRQTVVEGAAYPQYAPSGHLVFVRNGTWVVAPFDVNRMQVTGPVARLTEDVTRDTSGAPLALVSASGALVYVSAQAGASRLAWVSRQGVESPVEVRQQAYGTPQFGPDGRRLVVDISGDIWVIDIERSSFSKLTGDSLATGYGAWTPDGARVVFRTALGIRVTNADGTGQPELLKDTSINDFPNAVTPDGAAVYVTRQTPDRSGDVYLVSLHNAFTPRPVVSTAAYEGGVRLSPDGRWMTYASDESGRFDVYARPTSGRDRRWPASSDGGTNALWSRAGGEIIYRQGNRIMSVAVRAAGQELTFGKPVFLFEQRFVIGTSVTFPNFDLSPDGQRFIVIKNQSNSGRLDVVLDWTEELKRLTGQ